MAEFRMPSLGADMESGKLVEWKVMPGDRVNRGDIIAVVETEKANIDVEVFESGVVDQLLIEPGTKVPVGAVLATIRADGEARPRPEAVAPAPQKPTPGRLKVSPSARRLAEELGIDLAKVGAAREDSVITRADIEQAAAAQKAAPAVPPPATATRTGEAADFQAGMRRAIALAMARANREIPHYYLETRIDMSHALRWLEAENEKRSMKDRLLPAVLLIRAVALALREVPELNGYWIDDRHQPKEAVHIGFAIALREGGLMAPAIHDAHLKSVDEIMANLSDLIIRTRSGHLRGSEMTDATITLTNLGDLGVETVYGVIYPPQVALVGFGKISEQPWAENGMLGIRPVLSATLAADHRATDGRRGGQFLDVLNRYLQQPEKL
jgi:pyruvate dehydrogenase E2 component (dihydrolipoamide acetyltransferase)